MPFNQEITMSYDGMPTAGGVMMEGTWFNRITGDSFTVRDSYFEDNNFRVKTTDGRVMDYNTFQNYVQVNPKDLPALKKEYQQSKNAKAATAQPKISVGNLDVDITPVAATDSYEDLMVEDPLFAKMSAPASSGAVTKRATEAQAPKDNDRALIEKALKHQSIPSFKMQFTWDNFPQKQIDALTEVIDIPVDKVIDYIYEETMESMEDEIRQQLKEYINSKINS